MPLLFCQPPTLLSYILSLNTGYFILNTSLIRMLLMLLTRKIPLSFFKSSFDPFWGIVVTVASCLNCGNIPKFFIVLSIFNRECFRLFPYMEFLNNILDRPCGYLALLIFNPFRTFFNSCMVNCSVTFFKSNFGELLGE